MISTVAAPTDLSGKACLVTGANGGIGQSVCEHFLALDAVVYATDVGASFDHDDAVTYVPFDLLDPEGLKSCVEWIEGLKPDVLFNNAALFDMGSVLEADLAQYDLSLIHI